MKRTFLLLPLLFILHDCLRAQPADSTRFPVIRSGTIEAGIAGSLVAVEGLSRMSILLRGGGCLSIGEIVTTAEAEIGYGYVNGLGALDLQWSIGMTNVINGSTVWPYLALSAGIRQEWLGSFSQFRYPVGGDVGARVLVSRSAALRLSYRYRVVLDDPVEAFSEHHILLGISLLFENREGEGSME